MTTIKHTTKVDDDHELEKLANELEADNELYGATLDGLNARIDANLTKLEESDVDANIAAAEDETAEMAVKVMEEDAADMADLDKDMEEVEAEEDKNLEDDELPPEATAATLTTEDTGLPEQ